MNGRLSDRLGSRLCISGVLGLLMVHLGAPSASCSLREPDTFEQTSRQVMDTPEEVAAKATGAFARGDLQTFAALVDPLALREFHDSLTEVLDAVDRAPKGDPRRGQLERFLGAGPKKLRKLDARRFFIQFMRGALDEAPMLAEAMSGTEYETLGHVLEPEEVAHVIARYRMSVNDIAITETTVVSLRRTEAGWRLLLSDNVQGLVQALRQEFLGPSEESSAPAAEPVEEAPKTVEADPASPEAVAARAMTALKQGEFEAYVSLMDPVALGEFRALMMEAVVAVEDMAEEDPRAFGLQLFFASDAAELRRLDPQGFFLRFLAGAIANVPEILQMTYGDVQVVGHLLEADDIAQVIIRSTWTLDYDGQTKLTVVTLRRGEDGWRVLPRGNLLGIARALRQQVLD